MPPSPPTTGSQSSKTDLSTNQTITSCRSSTRSSGSSSISRISSNGSGNKFKSKPQAAARSQRKMQAKSRPKQTSRNLNNNNIIIMSQHHQRINRTRTRQQMMCRLAVCVSILALAFRPTGSLAQDQHYYNRELNLDTIIPRSSLPQRFGELVPNSMSNYYHPRNTANDELLNQYNMVTMAPRSYQNKPPQQQQLSQFLTPTTGSQAVANTGGGGDNLMNSMASDQFGAGMGTPTFAAANRIGSPAQETTNVSNDVAPAGLIVRASGADSGSTGAASVESTTTQTSEINREAQNAMGLVREAPSANAPQQSAVETPSTKDLDQQQQQQQANVAPNEERQANHWQASSEQRHDPADHDVVQSTPSPMGKILAAVPTTGRGDSSPMTVGQLNQTSTRQAWTSDNLASVVRSSSVGKADLAASESATMAPMGITPTTTTTTTTPAPSSSIKHNQQSPTQTPPVRQQVLKPQRLGAQQANKDPLKTLEQQIINQHARASGSSSTTSGQRYETASTKAASSASSSAPTQQLRLVPSRLRDNKLLNSLLSTLIDHNSATDNSESSSSSSTSSSSAASVDGRQQKQRPIGGSVLSSLAESFKSGITSRSSIVKAAMGDNKLARTLSNVGKTIGGNKYVAGAGIAAALAALGLTVSKLLTPYVLSGANSPYSKLSSEPMMFSASHPSYAFSPAAPGSPVGADSAGYFFFPNGNTNQQPNMDHFSEPMIAAANNPTHDTSRPMQPPMASNHYGGPTSESYMTAGNPSGAMASQDGANGHYTNFYSTAPPSEHVPTSSGASMYPSASTPPFTSYETNYQAQVTQPPAQYYPSQGQQGSYVSGEPSLSGGPANQYSNSIGADPTQYYATGSSADHQQAFNSQPSYEQQSAPVNNNQFNSDQIMASASSEHPTAFYHPYQSPPRRPNLLASSNPRRSGAVSLKLNDRTRNLLRQQLEAEEMVKTRQYLERMPAFASQADQSKSFYQFPVNQKQSQRHPAPAFTDSTQQQQQQAPKLATDPSSFTNVLEVGAPTVRNQWQPSSSLSSMAPSSTSSSAGGLKSSRLAADSVAAAAAKGVTNKSDYKGQSSQQKQFVTRSQQQQRKTMADSGGDLVGPIRAGPMQTSRNEASSSNSNSRPPVYQLITPTASRWQASESVAVSQPGRESSSSNGISGKQLQQQEQLQQDWKPRQQQQQEQPPRVMSSNVDTAAFQQATASQLDFASPKPQTLHETTKAVEQDGHGPNGGSTGWQSLDVASKQTLETSNGVVVASAAANEDKNSLSLAANESDSLVTAAGSDENENSSSNNNNKSSQLTDEGDDQQLMTAAASRAARVSRTPARDSPSWQPAYGANEPPTGGGGRRSLDELRDYAKAPRVVVKHSSGESKPSAAGRRPQASNNNRGATTTDADDNDAGIEDSMRVFGPRREEQQQQQQQRQEELLQVVANGMGSNLIQSSHMDGSNGNGGSSGTEYHTEPESNISGGGNSFESAGTDKQATKAELIEAKASPAAKLNNADSMDLVSVAPKKLAPVEASRLHTTSSSQHDQHDGASVVVELLPNDGDAGRISSLSSLSSSSNIVSSSAGLAGGSGRLQLRTGETETNGAGPASNGRAFRGLVAGSIGTS